MKINVLPVPNPDSRNLLKESTVVVVDVLRASSTILEALTNGAKEIIPVEEPEQAIKLKSQYPTGQVILSGERMGLKIEGFDLGNSPSDFTPETVNGKIIVMCSTNGTKAITFASIARKVYIGTFRNLNGIVDKLKSASNDIYLLGSGKFGQFCLEDIVCTGAIIDLMDMKNIECELSDSAISAQILYQKYKSNLLEMLHMCEHGKYLISLGFGNDLEYCSRLNTTPRIPELKNGAIY